MTFDLLIHWRTPFNSIPNRFLLIALSVLLLPCLSARSSPHKAATPDTHWIYKTLEDKELTMDIFLPEGYGEPGRVFPFAIYFHGGSWDQGSPANHYPNCAYWAKRGMVAASANYRLRSRDKVKVPIECLKDAKAAIRHIRANAKELQIDPERIVVAGDSAGAMLAAGSALIESEETSHSDDPKVSCTANALILHCPYWKTGCSPELMPPNFVREGLPPVIMFLGDSDQAISVDSIKQFLEALKSKGNASELHVGVGGKHGFTNGPNPLNKFFYWALALEDDFLVNHGILNGNAMVQRPATVPLLKEGLDYTSYR
jgi:acetyl esterase